MRTTTAILTLAAGAALFAPGCSAPAPRAAPQRVVAPYDTTEGEVLWAVVPLRNESGTSVFDPLSLSDKLAAAAQEVEGVACLPVNRTVQAMRALGMDAVRSPEDAAELAGALGVDGLVLGSVTAWDPYDPPVVGLSLGLYARGQRLGGRTEGLDARALGYASTDHGTTRVSSFGGAPVATASLHLDARDSGVLSRVREHAAGRADPATALGWRVYLVDMDSYASFAAHRGVSELLESEWVRLARARSEDEASAPGSAMRRNGGGS